MLQSPFFCGSRCSIESELEFVFVALEPPQSHAHGLNVLGYNCIVCLPVVLGVVVFNRILRFCPPHFDDSLAHGNHSFGGDEYAR